MSETLEIFDTVSGTVVACGSATSLINYGYDIQWDSMREKWFLRTYHSDLDEDIEEFLETSDYELVLREA